MYIHFENLSRSTLEYLRELRNKNREWFLDDREIDVINHIGWFSRSVGSKDINLIIINELNEKIGFISVYDITPDGIAKIGRMIIDEPYRHKGYMERSMIKVMDLCRIYYNLKELVLEVKHENIVARNLYAKMGFLTVGFTKEILIMRKFL